MIKETEKCNPTTCLGECDGKGWCNIAQEWQEKIHHDTFFPNAIRVIKRKKRKKNRKKNQRR